MANRRSGTVTLIDTERLAVTGELEVAESLADLAKEPGSGGLLALDDAAHKLLVLSASTGGAGLKVVHRSPVSPHPVRLARDEDRNRLFVTSVWSRRLEVFEVSPGAPPRRTPAHLPLS